MGIAIPQLAPASLDRTSGAQVIDGSLKFDDDSSNVLKRTPGSAGNRRTWTWSSWVKRTTLGTEGGIFSTYADAHPNTSLFWESEALKFHDYTGSYNIRLGTSAVFRDTSAWYHIVLTYDSTESTASDRAKLYVNGTLQTLSGTTVPSNFETDWNSTTEHNIGRFAAYFDGSMSQCYFIDGQALDASYFGYTDPLTNTWRTKKYEGTFGTNGFYLPFDGNTPIGQDKSGQGNDWTPVNFGGSLELDNPQVSGARPILNTTQGGTQAGVGVFGSKENVGYAVTVYDDGGGNKYYIDGVKQDTVTGLIRGATYTFDTSDQFVLSSKNFV